MACCSNKFHICLNHFPSLVWILFVMEVLDMAFPKYVLIYLFGKPVASSYPLGLRCMIAWILKLSRISVSMAFNLILCHMLICCEVGLEFHSDTTKKYLHTTCPWQVRLIIVVELVDHLHIGSCFELPYFIAKDLLWSNSHLSSLYLLDLFALLKICFVFSCVGKSNDPISVHLHSKVILLDNALFLVKLSYIE